MTFGAAIKSYFAKYATFSGRASRREFWFAVLFTALVSAAISIAFPGGHRHIYGMDIRQSSTMSDLWSLATLIPSLALTWRRLHDIGKSGKYFFYILIPIAGPIMLLIQVLKDGDKQENTYGEAVQ